MTFSQFLSARRAVVNPDGDSRRLDQRHKNWVISDLIDLQRYCPQFRVGHVSEYTAWTDECGSSYVPLPYGTLTNAFVVSVDSSCDRIQCTPITEVVMRRAQKQWSMCFCSTATGTPSSGGSSGGSGSSSSMFGIAGLNELRNTVPVNNQTYALLWLLNENDGLGGWFVYDQDDTHDDDGVDYIVPATVTRPAPGSFVRNASL